MVIKKCNYRVLIILLQVCFFSFPFLSSVMSLEHDYPYKTLSAIPVPSSLQELDKTSLITLRAIPMSAFTFAASTLLNFSNDTDSSSAASPFYAALQGLSACALTTALVNYFCNVKNQKTYIYHSIRKNLIPLAEAIEMNHFRTITNESSAETYALKNFKSAWPLDEAYEDCSRTIKNLIDIKTRINETLLEVKNEEHCQAFNVLSTYTEQLYQDTKRVADFLITNPRYNEQLQLKLKTQRENQKQFNEALIQGFSFLLKAAQRSSFNDSSAEEKSNFEVLDAHKDRERTNEIQKSAEQTVTFKDIAGLSHDTQAELNQIVEYLHDNTLYLSLGAKPPRGILLEGPPGNGKTLIAQAIAGEAQCPFFDISASEFVNQYVGKGASNVRDFFDKAKKHKNAILFIDEIDAVGAVNRTGSGGGSDEYRQTLNQILTCMDGFDKKNNTIVIAATNLADKLDPALRRAGRFDRIMHIPNPDTQARLAVLTLYVAKLPKKDDSLTPIALQSIAENTDGLSCADLSNLVNQAALIAVRSKAEKVTITHLQDAMNKIKAERITIKPEVSVRSSLQEVLHKINPQLE